MCCAARAFDPLCTIPGAGRITAMALLVECPELGTMTKKQAASLAGVAPMTRQWGQWRGQAFLQGGRKFLRHPLDMPALVALMRKLMIRANTLVAQNREWAPKTT